jgi:glycerophosphoryl diester phosphodiesterase
MRSMTKKALFAAGAFAALAAAGTVASAHSKHLRTFLQHRFDRHPRPVNVQVGPRPYYLVDNMDEGVLKDRLLSCSENPMRPSQFSIGHRGGGTLQIPEETAESTMAGARMGAGILECDVVFTKDKELVCRHSQCDLHTTTNILTVPGLAAKCTQPFVPANPATGAPAQAMCCTSDITLADFKQLCGKMDGFNPNATTPEEYQHGTPPWRTDLYATCGTVLSHDDYIDLVDHLGRNFTPELKLPSVAMPFDGFTTEQYEQKMIDAYKVRGISPHRVYAQSFEYPDILYWLAHDPAFGKQAVFLDGLVDTPGGVAASIANMAAVRAAGVNIIGPPTWVLVTTDATNHIVPSDYARAAKAQGFDIITWTLERSGPLATTGRTDYYYQSVTPAIDNDGDTYKLLDVLARQVGIRGIFSDWAGTVTYYANCMGLGL